MSEYGSDYWDPYCGNDDDYDDDDDDYGYSDDNDDWITRNDPGSEVRVKISAYKPRRGGKEIFKEFYKSGTFCDVTLVAEGKEFACHRIVLAATSEYFNLLLTANFCEKDAERIEMPSSAKCLTYILDFIYGPGVEIPKDEIKDLFIASHMVGISELQKICVEKLRRLVLNTANCLEMYFFAKLYDITDLMSSVNVYIFFIDFGKILEEHDDFVHGLSLEQIIELTKLRKGEGPVRVRAQSPIDIEDHMCGMVIGWLEHDWQERQCYSSELFKNIFIHGLSDGKLKELMKNEHLKDSVYLMKVIDEICYVKEFPNRWHEIDSDSALRDETYEKYIYFIRTCPAEHINNDLYGYETSASQRTSTELTMAKLTKGNAVILKDISFERSMGLSDIHAVSVEANDLSKLYVTAKDTRGTIILFKIDEEGYLIKQAESKSQASRYNLLSLDEDIYMIGGSVNGRPVDMMLRYRATAGISGEGTAEEGDPGSWLPVASLPCSLRDASAVTYKGEIYIFGGETCRDNNAGIHESSMACKYNPESDSYTLLPSMDFARVGAFCGIYRNKIYVVGGYEVSEQGKQGNNQNGSHMLVPTSSLPAKSSEIGCSSMILPSQKDHTGKPRNYTQSIHKSHDDKNTDLQCDTGTNQAIDTDHLDVFEDSDTFNLDLLFDVQVDAHHFTEVFDLETQEWSSYGPHVPDHVTLCGLVKYQGKLQAIVKENVWRHTHARERDQIHVLSMDQDKGWIKNGPTTRVEYDTSHIKGTHLSHIVSSSKLSAYRLRMKATPKPQRQGLRNPLQDLMVQLYIREAYMRERDFGWYGSYFCDDSD